VGFGVCSRYCDLKSAGHSGLLTYRRDQFSSPQWGSFGKLVKSWTGELQASSLYVEPWIFTFCCTYVSQESFLKKFIRKRCFEPHAFVYSLTHLPFSFRVWIYERLSAHKSARALKVERNCTSMIGTVNRSPDNRGSTVYEWLLHVYICWYMWMAVSYVHLLMPVGTIPVSPHIQYHHKVRMDYTMSDKRSIQTMNREYLIHQYMPVKQVVVYNLEY
jgi:hypothetical protein